MKRRLDVSDYAALQGWDTAAQKSYLIIGRNRFLTDSELREALGNGFDMVVFEAIHQQLLLCHCDAAVAIHTTDNHTTDEENSGTKVRPRHRLL